MKVFILFLFCVFTSVGSSITYAQSTASKNVSHFNIEAPQLGTTKTIWIYLPNSYNSNQQTYPVIYMPDGQNLFDDKTSYVGEWGIDEYLDSLSSNQAIIVGIEHGNDKRLDELTPYANSEYGGGNGDNYLNFVVNTLKPYIDQQYRTKTDAHYNAFWGSSLGGLMAFYATVKYPNIFANAVVFSPSFWYSDKIYDFTQETTIPETSRFYFLIGTEESGSGVADQNKMVTLLKSKGVTDNNIVNNIIDGGQHNEAFWKAHFADAYNWLIIK
ncbi:alpha/beta hydrolase [Mangrovimonas sp. YM274]|uniref:alpha/beta hydrolase n=1 Tax=Mangrovimonas sp. YM274 TaxID=3070660 RepID=UPI0027DE9BFF|nr:alpha/beta hydrolase-fold protein [Mangrovimonas sp. YM274]WMI67855.1 alpha/beta hydrolase-fold protein [Mangrovimonas sp. YM274]